MGYIKADLKNGGTVEIHESAGERHTLDEFVKKHPYLADAEEVYKRVGGKVKATRKPKGKE